MTSSNYWPFLLWVDSKIIPNNRLLLHSLPCVIGPVSCLYQIWVGTSKNQDYFLDHGPLVVQASPAGCSRNPSLPVYQLLCLWEAVFGFSEFFWKTQCVCPFHDGWFMSTPAHTTLSVWQFLTKNGMIPAGHVPPTHSPNLAPSAFFLLFPQMKKVLRGKCFDDVKEVKQKKQQKH